MYYSYVCTSVFDLGYSKARPAALVLCMVYVSIACKELVSQGRGSVACILSIACNAVY